MPSFLSSLTTRIETIGKLLGFNESIIHRITTPDQIIEKQVAFEHEGHSHTYVAYRAQSDNSRGPYKGGIRFHPDVDRDEVSALALGMSLKTAVVNIPMGGGKGGMNVDAKDLSPALYEKLCRGWVRVMHEHIGPDTDIPAPDMYTNPYAMAYMLDEYEHIIGRNSPATFTGKPLELGGSQGRTQATGFGGITVLDEYLSHSDKKVSGHTYAIQGFGNVGSYASDAIIRDEGTVVAIADSSSAIYDSRGLDPVLVKQHKHTTGSLSGFEQSKSITPQELLSLEVDVLVLAATENQITQDNAHSIQAKIILELANGPVHDSADALLKEQGTVVIPDILANAGGVTVSYFEWVQNRSGYYINEEEILAKLDGMMRKATQEVILLAEEHTITLRDAALMLAIKRLATAHSLRGNRSHE